MRDRAEHIIAAALIRGYVAQEMPRLKWRVGGWRHYEDMPLGYGDTDGRFGHEPPHDVHKRCYSLSLQIMRSGQRASFETTSEDPDVAALIEIDGGGVRSGRIPPVPSGEIQIAHEMNTRGAGPALVLEMDRAMRILTGCEPCQSAVYGPEGRMTLASDDTGAIAAFARLIEVPTGVDFSLEVDYDGTWMRVLSRSDGCPNTVHLVLDNMFKHAD